MILDHTYVHPSIHALLWEGCRKCLIKKLNIIADSWHPFKCVERRGAVLNVCLHLKDTTVAVAEQALLLKRMYICIARLPTSLHACSSEEALSATTMCSLHVHVVGFCWLCENMSTVALGHLSHCGNTCMWTPDSVASCATQIHVCHWGSGTNTFMHWCGKWVMKSFIVLWSYFGWHYVLAGYVHQSVQRTGRSSLNLKVVVATASVYHRKQLVCCSVHTSLHRSTTVLRTVVVPPLLWMCVWIMWSVVSLVRMFWYGALHKHKCTDRCQHATLLYGTEMLCAWVWGCVCVWVCGGVWGCVGVCVRACMRGCMCTVAMCCCALESAVVVNGSNVRHTSSYVLPWQHHRPVLQVYCNRLHWYTMVHVTFESYCVCADQMEHFLTTAYISWFENDM